MQNKINNNGNENGSIVILSPGKVAEILEVKESFVKRLLREGKKDLFPSPGSRPMSDIPETP